MKPNILLVAVAALPIATAALAASLSVVDQKGLAFSVSALTVKKGTVVEFTNSDNTPHNILITGGGATIDGGLQQPGVAYRIPFLKSGSYDVICGIHPKMHMTVTVE